MASEERGYGRMAPPDSLLLIPFDGDGHWYMCFDYRSSGPRGVPSITFVDFECEREELVAQNFLEFLSGLVDEVAEKSIRVYGHQDAEGVARAIATHLQLTQPSEDEFSEGFPTWRIALPGEAEWCWLSPNRVPTGFRREGSRVITTDATALRLPEDPNCSVLVSVTDGSGQMIGSALAALGLSTGRSDTAT